MPVVAGSTSGNKYTTYLFGEGAVGHGEGGAPSLEDIEAVETDRDALAGDDTPMRCLGIATAARAGNWTLTAR